MTGTLRPNFEAKVWVYILRKVSVSRFGNPWGDENVWEPNRGGGSCTTLQMYELPLNCSLYNG